MRPDSESRSPSPGVRVKESESRSPSQGVQVKESKSRSPGQGVRVKESGSRSPSHGVLRHPLPPAVRLRSTKRSRRTQTNTSITSRIVAMGPVGRFPALSIARWRRQQPLRAGAKSASAGRGTPIAGRGGCPAAGGDAASSRTAERPWKRRDRGPSARLGKASEQVDAPARRISRLGAPPGVSHAPRPVRHCAPRGNPGTPPTALVLLHTPLPTFFFLPLFSPPLSPPLLPAVAVVAAGGLPLDPPRPQHRRRLRRRPAPPPAAAPAAAPAGRPRRRPHPAAAGPRGRRRRRGRRRGGGGALGGGRGADRGDLRALRRRRRRLHRQPRARRRHARPRLPPR